MSNRGKACQCFPSKFFSAACLPRCSHLSTGPGLRAPVLGDLLGRVLWASHIVGARPHSQQLPACKKARELRAVFIWRTASQNYRECSLIMHTCPITLLHHPYVKDISGWKEFSEGGPETDVLKTPTEDPWADITWPPHACQAVIYLWRILLILAPLLSPLLDDFSPS